MQKEQKFSCLFRHYAKHNGLRKEDLVFYFVNELQPDETPESVHLMRTDEIWVEHRKDSDVKPLQLDAVKYHNQFSDLLQNPVHSDVTFIFNKDSNQQQQLFQQQEQQQQSQQQQVAVVMDDDNVDAIKAHKSILSARSAYFSAMFREGGMSESIKHDIAIKSHDSSSFRRMLEYIYTNKIASIDTISVEEILALIQLANEYVLDDLLLLCEEAGERLLSFDNISKFTLMSHEYNIDNLKKSCKRFIVTHYDRLSNDSIFRSELIDTPELGLILFDLWALKKDSTNANGGGAGYSGNSIMPSSPSSSANKRRRIDTNDTLAYNNI